MFMARTRQVQSVLYSLASSYFNCLYEYSLVPHSIVRAIAPSAIPRQAQIPILQQLMQMPSIIPQIRQRNRLCRPSSASLVLRSAVEVYGSIEGRCRYPFELLSWVTGGFLFWGQVPRLVAKTTSVAKAVGTDISSIAGNGDYLVHYVFCHVNVRRQGQGE